MKINNIDNVFLGSENRLINSKVYEPDVYRCPFCNYFGEHQNVIDHVVEKHKDEIKKTIKNLMC